MHALAGIHEGKCEIGHYALLHYGNGKDIVAFKVVQQPHSNDAFHFVVPKCQYIRHFRLKFSKF